MAPNEKPVDLREMTPGEAKPGGSRGEIFNGDFLKKTSRHPTRGQWKTTI